MFRVLPAQYSGVCLSEFAMFFPLLCAAEHISFTDAILLRAKELVQCNIKSYDALHIASAEAAKADVFLTTDSKLVNAAKKAGTHIPAPESPKGAEGRKIG